MSRGRREQPHCADARTNTDTVMREKRARSRIQPLPLSFVTSLRLQEGSLQTTRS
jgi:hypothetical protein